MQWVLERIKTDVARGMVKASNFEGKFNRIFQTGLRAKAVPRGKEDLIDKAVIKLRALLEVSYAGCKIEVPDGPASIEIEVVDDLYSDAEMVIRDGRAILQIRKAVCDAIAEGEEVDIERLGYYTFPHELYHYKMSIENPALENTLFAEIEATRKAFYGLLNLDVKEFVNAIDSRGIQTLFELFHINITSKTARAHEKLREVLDNQEWFFKTVIMELYARKITELGKSLGLLLQEPINHSKLPEFKRLGSPFEIATLIPPQEIDATELEALLQEDEDLSGFDAEGRIFMFNRKMIGQLPGDCIQGSLRIKEMPAIEAALATIDLKDGTRMYLLINTNDKAKDEKRVLLVMQRRPDGKVLGWKNNSPFSIGRLTTQIANQLGSKSEEFQSYLEAFGLKYSRVGAYAVTQVLNREDPKKGRDDIEITDKKGSETFAKGKQVLTKRKSYGNDIFDIIFLAKEGQSAKIHINPNAKYPDRRSLLCVSSRNNAVVYNADYKPVLKTNQQITSFKFSRRDEIAAKTKDGFILVNAFHGKQGWMWAVLKDRQLRAKGKGQIAFSRIQGREGIYNAEFPGKQVFTIDTRVKPREVFPEEEAKRAPPKPKEEPAVKEKPLVEAAQKVEPAERLDAKEPAEPTRAEILAEIRQLEGKKPHPRKPKKTQIKKPVKPNVPPPIQRPMRQILRSMTNRTREVVGSIAGQLSGIGQVARSRWQEGAAKRMRQRRAAKDLLVSSGKRLVQLRAVVHRTPLFIRNKVIAGWNYLAGPITGSLSNIRKALKNLKTVFQNWQAGIDTRKHLKSVKVLLKRTENIVAEIFRLPLYIAVLPIVLTRGAVELGIKAGKACHAHVQDILNSIHRSVRKIQAGRAQRQQVRRRFRELEETAPVPPEVPLQKPAGYVSPEVKEVIAPKVQAELPEVAEPLTYPPVLVGQGKPPAETPVRAIPPRKQAQPEVRIAGELPVPMVAQPLQYPPVPAAKEQRVTSAAPPIMIIQAEAPVAPRQTKALPAPPETAEPLPASTSEVALEAEGKVEEGISVAVAPLESYKAIEKGYLQEYIEAASAWKGIITERTKNKRKQIENKKRQLKAMLSKLGETHTRRQYLLKQREITLLQEEIEELEDDLRDTVDDILVEISEDVFEKVGDASSDIQVRKKDKELKKPYWIQEAGARIIARGKIAEIISGAGKTLCFALPTVLSALAGEGVHLVMHNDPLAREHARDNHKIYNAFGLIIGVTRDYKADEFVKKLEDEEGTLEGLMRKILSVGVDEDSEYKTLYLPPDLVKEYKQFIDQRIKKIQTNIRAALGINEDIESLGDQKKKMFYYQCLLEAITLQKQLVYGRAKEWIGTGKDEAEIKLFGDMARFGADITAGEVKAYMFDYLQDRQKSNAREQVQGRLARVIIDEVDYVLLDEARNPCVIAERDAEKIEDPQFVKLNKIVVRIIDAQIEQINKWLGEIDAALSNNIGNFRTLPRLKGEKGQLSQREVLARLLKAQMGNPGIDEDLNKRLRVYLEDPYISSRLLRYRLELEARKKRQQRRIRKTKRDEEEMRLLEEGLLFRVERGKIGISLTEAGREFLEKKDILPQVTEEAYVDSEWSAYCTIMNDISNLMRAHLFIREGKDYSVDRQRKDIIIINTALGRQAQGVSLRDLHKAVEAKEGFTEFSRGGGIMASITVGEYFSLYSKLAGATGTATSQKELFEKLHGITAEETKDKNGLPPDSGQIYMSDQVYETETAKHAAMIEDIVWRHTQGRPVYVCNGSVSESNIIAGYLKKEKNYKNFFNWVKEENLDINNPRDRDKIVKKLDGIFESGNEENWFFLINAENQKPIYEDLVIKYGGRKGAITVSTVMLARGADIRITDEADEAGGLYVVISRHFEDTRNDKQARNRAARLYKIVDGEPSFRRGNSVFYISLEDPLIKRFGGAKKEKVLTRFRSQSVSPITGERILPDFIINILEPAFGPLVSLLGKFNKRLHVAASMISTFFHMRRKKGLKTAIGLLPRIITQMWDYDHPVSLPFIDRQLVFEIANANGKSIDELTIQDYFKYNRERFEGIKQREEKPKYIGLKLWVINFLLRGVRSKLYFFEGTYAFNYFRRLIIKLDQSRRRLQRYNDNGQAEFDFVPPERVIQDLVDSSQDNASLSNNEAAQRIEIFGRATGRYQQMIDQWSQIFIDNDKDRIKEFILGAIDEEVEKLREELKRTRFIGNRERREAEKTRIKNELKDLENLERDFIEGRIEVTEKAKQIILLQIMDFREPFLAFVEEMNDAIWFRTYANLKPLDEFVKEVTSYFTYGKGLINETVLDILKPEPAKYEAGNGKNIEKQNDMLIGAMVAIEAGVVKILRRIENAAPAIRKKKRSQRKPEGPFRIRAKNAILNYFKSRWEELKLFFDYSEFFKFPPITVITGKVRPVVAVFTFLLTIPWMAASLVAKTAAFILTPFVSLSVFILSALPYLIIKHRLPPLLGMKKWINEWAETFSNLFRSALSLIKLIGRPAHLLVSFILWHLPKNALLLASPIIAFALLSISDISTYILGALLPLDRVKKGIFNFLARRWIKIAYLDEEIRYRFWSKLSKEGVGICPAGGIVPEWGMASEGVVIPNFANREIRDLVNREIADILNWLNRNIWVKFVYPRWVKIRRTLWSVRGIEEADKEITDMEMRRGLMPGTLHKLSKKEQKEVDAHFAQVLGADLNSGQRPQQTSPYIIEDSVVESFDEGVKNFFDEHPVKDRPVPGWKRPISAFTGLIGATVFSFSGDQYRIPSCQSGDESQDAGCQDAPAAYKRYQQAVGVGAHVP